MDYLDELDDSAMQALAELGSDISTFAQPAPSTSTNIPSRRRRRVEPTYLVRLADPLATPRDVANALGLSRVPQVELGRGENDEKALFCRLPETAARALDRWVETSSTKPKLVQFRLDLAHKDTGHLPHLGRDATLPQHRPALPVKSADSLVNEYPVYFFFYGTLADPELLARHFNTPASQLPRLQPATLLDGRIRIWGDKYRAVVDSPGDKVEGHAFLVTSADQEEALRRYETDNYEVVGATLLLDGKRVDERTFRFAGCDDDLTG